MSMLGNIPNNYSNPGNQDFINNLMSQIQQARTNPQAFINMLFKNNPEAGKQIEMLLQTNNPQQLAMRMLEQRGINPNTIMQMFNKF